MTLLKVFFLTAFFLLHPFFTLFGQDTDSIRIYLNTRLKSVRSSDIYFGDQNYFNTKRVAIDSVYFSSENDTLVLLFNKALAEMPVREAKIGNIKNSIKTLLPENVQSKPIKIVANGVELSDLIPNYYRSFEKQNKNRLTQKVQTERKNVVTPRLPYEISSGLKNSNIAMWNSHGWYYEPKFDRWEWQRARLFTTLEDISPTVFVTEYITPMLENAGANVFNPRERDRQHNMVIVDNNGSNGKSRFKKPKKRDEKQIGFAVGKTPYVSENPFELGTSITFKSLNRKENVATYIPDIPESGDYSVYVSYGKGEGKVTYRVYHSGGTTDFEVDQQIGFGTWIYLGNFHFLKGVDKKASKVDLIIPEGSSKKFSADAVRFGGGMGVIERKGKTGGRARYFEGARYNIQFSGAPDTLVWKLNENDDYKDDYMSRGEWVDWLIGAPFGPAKNRQHPGLRIPIDLALAFHTDAGILSGDEIVGTLGIYSTDRDTSVFADGQSKYASRDLSDLIQTQIVDDINSIYKCDWKRRGMWNSQYSEAYRPQVPSMLLELLSHQNFNDVKYILHPKFRFDVSRAIYKAILRFLATQNGFDYVVQPLPVDHLSSEFVSGNSVKLSWQPVLDEIEPSAKPNKYMVYQRTGENGFDNGMLVEKPEIAISNLEKGKVYGFKITAVNAGGESFPSEIVSVGIAENSKGEILIVNGFDRVDGPEIFETDSLSGVWRQLDHGVAYGYDISTTGDQYDFTRKSVWEDDDNPGHGASYADLETTIFRGNTFDFSCAHGTGILAAGYNFTTCSDEAVENGRINLNNYALVDLLYGEEKTSFLPGKDTTPYSEIYTDKMLEALEGYTKNGGNILITGAYIGTDIPKDKETVNRVTEILKFKWRTNHAVKNGQFYSTSDDLNFQSEYNTDYNLEQYPVEAPDGIEPKDSSAQTIFRYSENNVSAGVLYKGDYKVVALGFPYESVKGDNARNKLMNEILKMLME
ncbi:fibronectin type III domain-containing protein [Prolixibacteraceae bacterium Z1-6]|uniref:Fibronectin type III domain-containing protein n=1 Tax=Draconibacterium aestuarii TaxID=2998507 RepID=A0A9X3F434_9BACT|nr:fibronectin type III domain-containing protein [Prolixibacteraceae bacterium Z1-6]